MDSTYRQERVLFLGCPKPGCKCDQIAAFFRASLHLMTLPLFFLCVFFLCFVMNYWYLFHNLVVSVEIMSNIICYFLVLINGVLINISIIVILLL